MIRRLVNSLIETTLQPYQTESLVYANPFTESDTLHLSWIASMAPCFPINARHIAILAEPKQFYAALQRHCATATKRITLASLYIGNGELETKLVEALTSNESFNAGTLHLNILLDYTRASRPKDNARVTLRPLLERGRHCACAISLYHTPVLRGLRKSLMPARYNEIFGLQHMKLYVFDDTLIISGANLSTDYFTNRQDRYFVIEDAALSDFYCGLVERVQRFSLRVEGAGGEGVRMGEGWSQLPYEGSLRKFVERARQTVESYLVEAMERQSIRRQSGFDTWIFPLVQMGQLGIGQDASVTSRLLADAPTGARLHIATGYFNLTRDYVNILLNSAMAECRLLMAHPNANGFKGAAGPAGSIPDAYSLLARRFARKINAHEQHARIVLEEYLREGWTYHAKGLWYYPPKCALPSLTLIGSPNFGERSVKRDLETQLAIVTENRELKTNLHEECTRLYGLALPANTSRTVSKWVYPIVYLFKGYF